MSASCRNILLTGATGFLGSHLAARLLEEGHALTLLARGSAQESAAERVRRMLDWHFVGPEARGRVRIVEGDLEKDSLGLESAEWARLLAETDEVVHCASETSFAERKRELLQRINVEGLGRLLEFAAQARSLREFHHVSTAYVAGRRPGLCREEWPAEPVEFRFHNSYEETKYRAEELLRDRCASLGMRVVVYRPSVVYGHSRTGRSLLFNAIYHPVRAAAFLRDVYLEDIRERGGVRARDAGVSLTPEGILRMPLRVEARGPGIDLVPVDFLTDAFAAIHASEQSAGVFHLVSGRPTPVADLAAFTSQLFRIDGFCTISPAEAEATPRTALEAAFDHMTEVYRPYMSGLRSFATDRSAPILARAGVACPEFTYAVFDRCMSYAVATDWGRRSAGA